MGESVNQFGRKSLLFSAALCLPLVLAGCGGDGVRGSRDFNELIPRMMGAVNSNSSPTQAAANLFNVTSPDERRDAIAYLQTKKYGHEAPYMKAYTLLATDPHPQVRAQAMRALGTSGDPSVAPTLVTGLGDAEAEVRRDAAAALLTTYGPEAEAPLRVHLREDEDDQVKINCARALRHFRSQPVIRALIDALDDRNAAVAYWSRESLIGLTGERMPVDTKTWLTWYQQRFGPPATRSGNG
jgi:HEAT repeat protein